MAKIRIPSAASLFKVNPISADAARMAEAATSEIPRNGEQAVRDVAKDEQVGASLVGDKKLVPAQVSENQDSFVIGQVYDLPLTKISSNPFNPRYIYTTIAVDEMAASLSEHGQRISATGYSDGKGGVYLIEGETRLRGARAAQLKTLRVEIREKPSTDQKLYEEARAANVERRDQTPLDDAMRWNELLSKGVYASQRALGSALGLSEDVISRTRSLANMSPQIIAMIAEYSELHTLKMLVAIREYWEASNDESTLELILDVVKGGLGSRDVTARRKALTAEPIKRTRSLRDVIEFRGGKGEIKAFEDEGRVEFSLKGLSKEQTKEVASLLKDFVRQ